MSSFSQVEWLIQGLIPQGHSVVIIGTPHSGKSWFLDSMGLSLASGSSFLNTFQSKRCSVIIHDEDTPTNTLHSRLQRLCPHLNELLCDDKLHIHSKESFLLADWKCLNVLIAEIKRVQPPVVVLIDSLSTVTTSNLNESVVASAAARGWQDLLNTGATVLITHHMSQKAEKKYDDPDFTRYSMGSTHITSRSDTMYGVWRLEPERPTRFIVRGKTRRDPLASNDPFAIELLEDESGIVPVLLPGIPFAPCEEARRILPHFVIDKTTATAERIWKLQGKVLSMDQIRKGILELEKYGVVVSGDTPSTRGSFKLNPDISRKLSMWDDYQTTALAPYTKYMPDVKKNGASPTEGSYITSHSSKENDII